MSDLSSKGKSRALDPSTMEHNSDYVEDSSTEHSEGSIEDNTSLNDNIFYNINPFTTEKELSDAIDDYIDTNLGKYFVHETSASVSTNTTNTTNTNDSTYEVNTSEECNSVMFDYHKLSYVDMMFIEMNRQSIRIGEIGEKASKQVSDVVSKLESLGSIVDVGVSDCASNLANKITERTQTIQRSMETQINAYQELNSSLNNKLDYLYGLIETLFDDDGQQIAYKSKNGTEYKSMSYQSLLDMYVDYKENKTKQAKMRLQVENYLGIDLLELQEKLNKNTVLISETGYNDLYEYIDSLTVTITDENGNQKVVSEAVSKGYKDAKEYINAIIETAKNTATTNREKAVNVAIALNSFCADHGVRLNYEYGAGHDSTQVSLDQVLEGTDCSSYISFLLNQGNSNFNTTNTTGLMKNGNIVSDLSNLQPGDIFCNSGHVMMFLGVDENGGIICSENQTSVKGARITVYNQHIDEKGRVYISDGTRSYYAYDMSDVYN